MNVRRGPWRRLTLIHHDRPFLVRRGIDVGLFGIYLHDIAAPDPGLDMHDHPWAFVTLILRGGYFELAADARRPELPTFRRWGRWSMHRMRQTDAHRITRAEPGTVTLVLRGRKTRSWGYYVPDPPEPGRAVAFRWIGQTQYDYAVRRPAPEVRT